MIKGQSTHWIEHSRLAVAVFDHLQGVLYARKPVIRAHCPKRGPTSRSLDLEKVGRKPVSLSEKFYALYYNETRSYDLSRFLGLAKYGKMLERILDSHDLTIFSTDEYDYSNWPFKWILEFILREKHYTVGDRIFYSLEFTDDIFDNKLISEFVKAYRQLTLYYYKIEQAFDESVHLHNFIIADAQLRDMQIDVLLKSRLQNTIKAILDPISMYLHRKSLDFTYPVYRNGVLVAPQQYTLLECMTQISGYNHSGGAIARYFRKESFVPRREYVIGSLADSVRNTVAFDTPLITTEEDMTSNLVFVPKDARGPRVICKEPGSLAILQQAVMKVLYRYLPSVTGGSIQLDNQQLNRDMAQYGALSGRYATIDLKAASDSITLSHITGLFPEDWAELLLSTRSKYTLLPNGIKMEQRKYAPMGSALCFPVQCIIFYAIARVATDYSDVQIYGDDIIVPSHKYDATIEMLQYLGFTVNIDKSFNGRGGYRESCGVHSYRGHDVSCAYRKKAQLTAEHVNAIRQHYPNYEPPYSDFLQCRTYSDAVLHGDVDLFNLLSFPLKWDSKHHYLCATVKADTAVKTGRELSDDLAYIEWLRVYSQDNRQVPGRRTIARRGVNIVSKDIDVPVLLSCFPMYDNTPRSILMMLVKHNSFIYEHHKVRYGGSSPMERQFSNKVNQLLKGEYMTAENAVQTKLNGLKKAFLKAIRLPKTPPPPELKEVLGDQLYSALVKYWEESRKITKKADLNDQAGKTRDIKSLKTPKKKKEVSTKRRSKPINPKNGKGSKVAVSAKK